MIDKTDEGQGGARLRSTLEAMALAMVYEKFLVHRTREFPNLGLYAGWTGQVDEVDARGPASNPAGGTTLFVAGEPYSAPDRFDRDSLGRQGTILRSYDQGDDALLSSVTGQFSMFLVDERRGRSLLFNDRFGIERLFLYEDAANLLFSSEAKGILSVAPETRNLDPHGLAEFLACGSTLGEASLFRRVRVLPAGTVMEFRRGDAPQARRYFDRAAWETIRPLPNDEFLVRLGAILETTVERQATPSDRVALSLTGGLDSRIIVSCLKVPAIVPCYTFGSCYRETYDVRVARRLAALSGQQHEVLVLDRAFIDGLQEYFEKAVFISDGHLGLSGAAELYLNKLARSVAPIRITGNYGGELLRGARAFKASMPEGDFVEREMSGRIRDAIKTFSRQAETNPLSFTLFCQAPAGYGRYAIERSQVTVRSPFLDDRVVQVLYSNPFSFGCGWQPSADLIAQRRPDLLGVPTDRGLLGSGGPVVRSLRSAYREGLFKAEYWTGHGASQWMAALTRKMPGLLVQKGFAGRHKFVHPRLWFRGRLGEYTREVLLAQGGSDLDNHFDRARITQLVNDHSAGTANHSEVLDKLLTIALIRRTLTPPIQ